MTNIISKWIKFFESREGLFAILLPALLVQAFHSGEVFVRISTSHWPLYLIFIHSALFAIVFELAVLLFVIRGRKKLAWLFAVFSIFMNCFYYFVPTDSIYLQQPIPIISQVETTTQFANNGSEIGNLITTFTDPNSLETISVFEIIAAGKTVASIVASIVLPLAIAFYSHEIAEETQSQNKIITTVTPVATKRRNFFTSLKNVLRRKKDFTNSFIKNENVESVATHENEVVEPAMDTAKPFSIETTDVKRNSKNENLSQDEIQLIEIIRNHVTELQKNGKRINKSQLARDFNVSRDFIYKAL